MAAPQTYPLDVEKIVGSYRLVRRLGQDNTGSVYEAIHCSLGRRAAIKFVHLSPASNPELVERMFQEARATNLIEDPGLPHFYEFGVQDGYAYLIMEYLEGQTLSQCLHDRQGKLPVSQALNIALQSAEILAALRKRDIAPRYLKPDAIMLVPDLEARGGERVKFLQFGITQGCGFQAAQLSAAEKASAGVT